MTAYKLLVPARVEMWRKSCGFKVKPRDVAARGLVELPRALTPRRGWIGAMGVENCAYPPVASIA